jgi:PST family polysaccharide transporter
MALARKAVVGAMWSVGAGLAARALTLVGTLATTRFLAPSEYGEVMVASVVVLSAHMLASAGVGQYVVSRPHASREETFHATVVFVALGAIALGLAIALGGPLASLLGAPGAARFLPGLALAALVERATFVPDRLLVRDMRFRASALVRSLGDVLFAVVAVGLAAAGFGGAAIVAATLARAVAKAVAVLALVEVRAWLDPCRLRAAELRALFAFGLPIAVAQLCDFASRRWDNLLVAALFGPAVAGEYNLAYNLADLPATQIGETVGDVLVPSLAHMEPSARGRALARALTLMTLVVAPLAVGLGVVAPTLVATFFDARWAAVAPMLALLAALSVVRPVAWIVAPLLQVEGAPRQQMHLELGKAALLLVCVAGLGLAGGPLAACTGVGVAFALNAAANLRVAAARLGVTVRSLVAPLAGPLLACAPMVASVLAARRAIALVGATPRGLGLAVEIAAGAAAFVPSAWLLAGSAARDLVGLLASRRRAKSASDARDPTESDAPAPRSA